MCVHGSPASEEGAMMYFIEVAYRYSYSEERSLWFSQGFDPDL
ncbi:hypothetical protein NSP_48400 [Nodularia spumigena CCY9414]|nr:hypothetical protein NSP_48400 [Nodularia spumigena CCY9414]